MKDITIIYYSACLIPEPFATNIREHLLSWIPDETPIISVTHKPVNFGLNIQVNGMQPSIYNIYKQILIGCHEIKTDYVMCMEDDALYNVEHFNYRPPKDTFAYNMHRWICDHNKFFHRNRANMSMCIAPTELMIKTLEIRFKKFPELLPREKLVGFGEPGRSEYKLGLPMVKIKIFNTETPTIVFNHKPSVGGIRKISKRDIIREELKPWGKALDLWNRMYGITS